MPQHEMVPKVFGASSLRRSEVSNKKGFVRVSLGREVGHESNLEKIYKLHVYIKHP